MRCFVFFVHRLYPRRLRTQVAEMVQRLEGRRQELIDLRGGYDSDDDSHFVVDSRTGEVVLSVKEVIQ